MRTIELTYPHTLLQAKLPKTVCAIGFFDGIHKGHRKVINAAVQEARNKKMTSAVMSFHPHPSVVLKKQSEPVQYITTLEEKKKFLQLLNVDLFYVITFNKELSLLPPREFIDHFIKDLHIKHLIAG